LLLLLLVVFAKPVGVLHVRGEDSVTVDQPWREFTDCGENIAAASGIVAGKDQTCHEFIQSFEKSDAAVIGDRRLAARDRAPNPAICRSQIVENDGVLGLLFESERV